MLKYGLLTTSGTAGGRRFSSAAAVRGAAMPKRITTEAISNCCFVIRIGKQLRGSWAIYRPVRTALAAGWSICQASGR